MTPSRHIPISIISAFPYLPNIFLVSSIKDFICATCFGVKPGRLHVMQILQANLVRKRSRAYAFLDEKIEPTHTNSAGDPTGRHDGRENTESRTSLAIHPRFAAPVRPKARTATALMQPGWPVHPLAPGPVEPRP
jgi:hypothetical protein